MLNERTLKNSTSWLAMTMLAMASLAHPVVAKAAPVSATALPTGANVIAGGVNIDVNDAMMNIHQAQSKGIINWDTFSIGSSASVNINNGGGVTLNRVTGNDVSHIMGQLQSDGQVMLINRNGVVFGQGARVDVNGLIASTADISDSNFLQGNYDFSIKGKDTAQIINEAAITINNAGLAAFVAPTVMNSGVITATLGKINLASGDRWTLDMGGLVKLEVTDEVAGSLVHTGQLSADGGVIHLTANQVRDMAQSAIQILGSATAQTVGTDSMGAIIIRSGGAGKVDIAGTLDASGMGEGQVGGAVHVTGEHITIGSSALLTAQGHSGGGEILVGGEYLGGSELAAGHKYSGAEHASQVDRELGGASSVNGSELGQYIATYYDTRTADGGLGTAKTLLIEKGSTMDASASHQGDGGRVIAWSDDATHFYGNIDVSAGQYGGDGGFIETSGKAKLIADGGIDLSSQMGRGGMWLLDPYDITIMDNHSAHVNFDGTSSTGDGSIADINLIRTALGSGSIQIRTGNGGAGSGDITLSSALNISTSNSLTLNAHNDIIINRAITQGGSGAVNFTAGTDGSGDVYLNNNVTLGSGSSTLTATGGTVNVDATLSGTNLTFVDDTVVGASGVITGTGNVAFNSTASLRGTVTAANLSTSTALVSASAATTFNVSGTTTIGTGGFLANSGNLVINTNELVLSGDLDGNNNTLTIAPLTLSTAMNVGNGVTTGLDIGSSALAQIGTGGTWQNIRFGKATSTGTMTYGGSWSFDDSNVYLYGSSMSGSGDIGAGSNSLFLIANSGSVNLGSGILTAGTLDVDAPVDIVSSATLNATTVDFDATAGDISQSGAVTATTASFDAGDDITHSSGNITTSGTLTMDAGGGITHSGGTIDAASFSATAGSGSIDVNSGISGGDVAFHSDTVMGSSGSVTATGNVDFNSTASLRGTVTGNNITTGASLVTTSADTNLTATAGTLTVGSGGLTASTGDLSISADELVLTGNLDGNGSNALTMAANTSGRAMNIANGVTTGLDISSATLANIGAGASWNELHFGSASTGNLGYGTMALTDSDVYFLGDSISGSGNVNAGSNMLSFTADNGSTSLGSGTLTASVLDVNAATSVISAAAMNATTVGIDATSGNITHTGNRIAATNVNLDAAGTIRAGVSASNLDIGSRSTQARITGTVNNGGTQNSANLVTGGPGNSAAHTLNGFTIRKQINASSSEPFTNAEYNRIAARQPVQTLADHEIVERVKNIEQVKKSHVESVKDFKVKSVTGVKVEQFDVSTFTVENPADKDKDKN